MKRQKSIFMKNIAYSVSSNAVSLLVSTLTVLIVPKFIGIQEYGFWQIYVFYISYAAVPSLGWTDGIYLRYGGRDYDNLNKSTFSSQFILLIVFEIALYLAYLFVITAFASQDKLFILYLVGVCSLVVVSRCFYSYILQATNRILDFSRIIIIEKVLYVILVVVVLISGYKGYRLLLVIDIISKFISLLYAFWICRDILTARITINRILFQEIWKNINAGIKLLVSGLASMLIIGIVRIGIENQWDVATFGKVSLALSFSNYLLVFITAIGIVLFPMLRRTPKDKLPGLYKSISNFILTVLFGMLIFYFPGKILLDLWLPAYGDSIQYMSFIFPICIYESKYVMITNTYLKAIRKEKYLAITNISCVLISLLLTLITTRLLHNLWLAVASILLLIIVRGLMSDIILSRFMTISVSRDIVLEIIITSLFIIFSTSLSSIHGMLLYIACFIVYLIVKHQEIKKLPQFLRLLFK